MKNKANTQLKIFVADKLGHLPTLDTSLVIETNKQRQIMFVLEERKFRLEFDERGFIYDMIRNPNLILARPNMFGLCCFKIKGVYFEVNICSVMGPSKQYPTDKYYYVPSISLEKEWGRGTFPVLDEGNIIARRFQVPRDAIVSEKYRGYSYDVKDIMGRREARVYNNATGAVLTPTLDKRGNVKYRLLVDNEESERVVDLNDIMYGS